MSDSQPPLSRHPSSFVGRDIIPVKDGQPSAAGPDAVAVEEPLEIRIGHQASGRWITTSLSVTMRTPGQDFDLAAGFLFSEGIIRSYNDIAAIQQVGRPDGNVVRLDLRPDVQLDLGRLERHFYTTSSCGVCGKTSLEALSSQAGNLPPRNAPVLAASVIHDLPQIARRSQSVFEQTGGLHAACLFDAAGQLLLLREDVGRHNAVDKLIGHQLQKQMVPLHDKLLFLSGRASFELMQKALTAGIPIVAAVGAPSSLAVDLAREYDLTLLGFVRDRRFNVYAGNWRILYETSTTAQLDSAASYPE
ncbi:MAG: formate dehydrogenase accessory sulfurtransferase FdhD [Bryobacteraceae bacterium]